MNKHPWKTVYVVTAWNKTGEEPVITAFDNEEAAESCQKIMLAKYDEAVIDQAPIYKKFIYTNTNNKA